MTDVEISHTEMATFARCPRKWAVGYYWAYRPAAEPATGPRILGSRVHAALEGWKGHGLYPVDVLNAIYAQAIEDSPDSSAELEAEAELAGIMVRGYREWLEEHGHDAGMTTVAAEQAISVPLPGLPGVRLRAKLDRVDRDEDGNRWWVDYKTSDSFERHEYLALDTQFKTYSLIEQIRAENADPYHIPEGVPMGGIVDTLRRCKRSSRSRPPYYARDRFRYGPEEIESTLLRITQLCEEILEARDRLNGAGIRGEMTLVNRAQRSVCRPVPVIRDCSWSCPLSKGLCVSMDDGSDWPGILRDSGAWVQENPYTYYSDDLLSRARERLAGNVPSPC